MTQTTPERKKCSVCPGEYTVVANGTIRHHFTDNPDFQAGPDSRKCRGAGEPPAGVVLPEDNEQDQSQCRLCKHPVVLTDNGRARSHLTPEATPRPCPAGSDFPLGVYPDIIGTTDGTVATLARDCGHVPAGECYACYGVPVPGRVVGDGDGTEPKPEPRETITHTGTNVAVVAAAPWGVDPAAVAQPTMADQLKSTSLTGLLERGTAGVGTVLDVMDGDMRAEAERFMAAAVPEQPTATVEHQYTDTSGIVWVHPGSEATCRTPECSTARFEKSRPEGFDPKCEQCDTDTHRCPGCGKSVKHGTVACAGCTARVDAEDAERQAKCTHPHGFIENDPVDDDGEGLVFRCGECGTVGIGDKPIGPDSELPNCPYPETHRAGCGCPDDDSWRREPIDGWRTPLDLMERMPEEIRGLDALRLNCRTCGHPVTPLVDHFAPDGRAAKVVWDCENHLYVSANPCRGHECTPDTRVLLGELEVGEHFIRRGAVMRVTSAGYGLVEAVVVEGPMAGRTGELKNPDEMVERTYCRHRYTYADDGKFGHSGSFCDYCDAEEIALPTTEQETKECTDDGTATRRPGSSAAPTNPTTAPAPGSPRATPASAPTVLPESNPVTSSGPTAKAAGRGGSAAVTTDQASAARFLGGGGPAATQATGARSQADAAAQFLAGGSGAHGEKETDRDRFGRYLILHPDTGKEQAWTRATTFAKSISDTFALSQWGLRMALLGATQRPDIVQRAHGKHVSADKKLLDELTAELKNAAGDKVAANLGTSMHSFTEMADRAWHSPGGPRSVLGQVPPDCREDVDTYIRLLEETGLEPVPNLIEFTTIVKQYGVAGTSDNCYRVTRPLTLKIGRAEVILAPGEYVIGDKKTGKDLDYGWQEIAIQLGVYAQGLNTCGRWDRGEKKWYPDPLNGAKVRLDAGIVVHLPVDKSGKKSPAVYGIDLESGWNAAVLCERVRAWRKVRNLASPVMVSEAETFAPARPEPAVTSRTTVRPASLKDRANAVTSRGEASAVWQAAKTAGLPDSEVDELVSLMQARLAKLSEPGG